MPCKLISKEERIQAAEKAAGRPLTKDERIAAATAGPPTFHCTPGKGIQGLGKARRRRRR